MRFTTSVPEASHALQFGDIVSFISPYGQYRRVYAVVAKIKADSALVCFPDGLVWSYEQTKVQDIVDFLNANAGRLETPYTPAPGC